MRAVHLIMSTEIGLAKEESSTSIQPWLDSDSFPEFQLEKPTMGSSANHAEKSKRLMPVGFGDWRENSARQEHLFFVVLKGEFVHSEKWVLEEATHSGEKGRFVLALQRLRTAPIFQACSVPWRNRIYMKGRRPVLFFFLLEIILTSFLMSKINLKSFKSAQMLDCSVLLFSTVQLRQQFLFLDTHTHTHPWNHKIWDEKVP